MSTMSKNPIFDTVREAFTAPTDPAQITGFIPMTAHDRCDVGQCGAQAYVRVIVSAGELYFCGHHFTEHKTKIDEVAAVVHDGRGLIGEGRLDVSA